MNNKDNFEQVSPVMPKGGRWQWISFLRTSWAQGLAIYGLMIVLGVCRTGSQPIESASGKASAPDKKRVRVVTRREGDMTHFLVENHERAEVTMTFNFALENLQCSKKLPLTATYAAGKTSEAFTLKPIDPDAAWQYSYTNYHNLGSADAQHDETVCYSLPYAAGRRFRVTQAYGGKFSHGGSNLYAVDWAMPEGTDVHAARAGLVVKVKDDSNRGGGDVSFDPFNNYVLIRHSDGTLGQYCHLKKGGVVVREGDLVHEGDVIAHSGNTGFSTGPHLHFSVYKMKNGKERESIPIKFRTTDGNAVTLQEGRKYTAPRATALAHEGPRVRATAAGS